MGIDGVEIASITIAVVALVVTITGVGLSVHMMIRSIGSERKIEKMLGMMQATNNESKSRKPSTRSSRV